MKATRTMYSGRFLISGQSKITRETVPIVAFSGLFELQEALHLRAEIALQMRLSTNRNEPLVVVSGGTTYMHTAKVSSTSRQIVIRFFSE